MPTYDFECGKCGTSFEVSCRIAEMDQPLSEPCPECSECGQIKRVICAPAVVGPNAFKGLSSDHKFAMKQMKKRHPNSNIPDY